MCPSPPAFGLVAHTLLSLPRHSLVSDIAGEVWYSASVLAALMLLGLAVFLVIFGALPYWFKLHKQLNEILGCEFSD